MELQAIVASPIYVLGTQLRPSGEQQLPLNWGAIFLTAFTELEKTIVILIYSGTFLLFPFHFHSFLSEILNA